MPEPAVVEKPSFSEVSDKAFEKMNAEPEKTPEKEEKTPAPVKAPAEKEGSEKDEIDEQTLSDLKAGKIIPHHRFNEILNKVSAYESFGTPEEVAAKLKAIAEKAKETPAPASAAEETEEDKAAKAYLLKLFPGLAKFPDLQKQIEDFQNSQKQKEEMSQAERSQWHGRLLQAGVESVKSLATENGINVKTQDNLDMVLRGVTYILNKDPDLRERFYVEGEVDAINQAFDQYFKALYPGVQRKAASDILTGKNQEKKLPKAIVQGGAHDEPEPKKPKTLNEVGDLAWEKLHQ